MLGLTASAELPTRLQTGCITVPLCSFHTDMAVCAPWALQLAYPAALVNQTQRSKSSWSMSDVGHISSWSDWCGSWARSVWCYTRIGDATVVAQSITSYGWNRSELQQSEHCDFTLWDSNKSTSTLDERFGLWSTYWRYESSHDGSSSQCSRVAYAVPETQCSRGMQPRVPRLRTAMPAGNEHCRMVVYHWAYSTPWGS